MRLLSNRVILIISHSITLIYEYKAERRFRTSGVRSNWENDIILEKTHATKIDYRKHMTIGNTWRHYTIRTYITSVSKGTTIASNSLFP